MPSLHRSDLATRAPGSSNRPSTQGARALAAGLAILALGVAPAWLAGCPAPEPPQAAVAPLPTEDDARAALDESKKKGDPSQLLDVYLKFRKFPSGRTALRLAVRKWLEAALDAADRCDEPTAAGNLGQVAPYTPDDREIDAAYDETRASVEREKRRCSVVKLDGDVRKAEADWDYPRAFNRILSEREVDGGLLKQRRLALTERWRAFIDRTLRAIVAKGAAGDVLGDKRDAWAASIDSSKLPAEVAAELGARGAAIAAVMLVFDRLEGGALIDPPVRYWTFGTPKARRIDAPSAEGTMMANGVPFVGVAKAKSGGVALIAAGNGEGDVLARLASIKLLVPETETRAFDTRGSLPDDLVGVRVLAPIAPGSDLLTPSTVLSESRGNVTVVPLAAAGKKTGARVTTKRGQLRGFVLPPGQAVTVLAGGLWKRGEVADIPEEDRVLVRTAGFESFFPLGDVRVKRGELPSPPPERH